MLFFTFVWVLRLYSWNFATYWSEGPPNFSFPPEEKAGICLDTAHREDQIFRNFLRPRRRGQSCSVNLTSLLSSHLVSRHLLSTCGEPGTAGVGWGDGHGSDNDMNLGEPTASEPGEGCGRFKVSGSAFPCHLRPEILNTTAKGRLRPPWTVVFLQPTPRAWCINRLHPHWTLRWSFCYHPSIQRRKARLAETGQWAHHHTAPRTPVRADD